MMSKDSYTVCHSHCMMKWKWYPLYYTVDCSLIIYHQPAGVTYNVSFKVNLILPQPIRICRYRRAR
jgi:hypothetical protein